MAYAFVVCVKINNDELFCNAIPFENVSGLDVVCTYYCVARVTCQVLVNSSF